MAKGRLNQKQPFGVHKTVVINGTHHFNSSFAQKKREMDIPNELLIICSKKKGYEKTRQCVRRQKDCQQEKFRYMLVYFSEFIIQRKTNQK